MNTIDNNQPEKASDAAGRMDSAAAKSGKPLDIRKLVGEMLGKSRNSRLWQVTAVGGGPIAPELVKATSIPVEVHIAVAQGGSAAKVLRAVLTRSRTANGDDEFTLTFESVDSTDYTPYAIWVGAIKQWSFPAETLGRLSPSAAPPTEAPEPVRLAGGSDGSVTPPRPGVGVSGLAAKAGASETPLVSDAERAADELRARNDNLDLRWHQGLLEIKVDCPPAFDGQPVILETEFLNQLGERRLGRRGVTLTSDVDDGEFAGYRAAEITFDAPVALQLAEHQFRITVRPPRADDLPCLNAAQVDQWLASQDLRVLNTVEDGFAMRFTARTDEQKRAATATDSVWLIRATARKKEG